MEGGQPRGVAKESTEAHKEAEVEPLRPPEQARDGAQEPVKDASNRHPPHAHAHLPAQGGAELSTGAAADAEQPAPDGDRQGEHPTVQDPPEEQQGRTQGGGNQLEQRPAPIEATAVDRPASPAQPPAPAQPDPQRSAPGCQCCGAGLEEERPYHKRYRVCHQCSLLPVVALNGEDHRFCQQCGAFHPIDAFRGDQRSCREQLALHAARRRRRRRERSGKRASSSSDGDGGGAASDGSRGSMGSLGEGGSLLPLAGSTGAGSGSAAKRMRLSERQMQRQARATAAATAATAARSDAAHGDERGAAPLAAPLEALQHFLAAQRRMDPALSSLPPLAAAAPAAPQPQRAAVEQPLPAFLEQLALLRQHAALAGHLPPAPPAQQVWDPVGSTLGAMLSSAAAHGAQAQADGGGASAPLAPGLQLVQLAMQLAGAQAGAGAAQPAAAAWPPLLQQQPEQQPQALAGGTAADGLAAVFAAYEQRQQAQAALPPPQALIPLLQQQPAALQQQRFAAPPQPEQQPAALLLQQLLAQLRPAQQAQGQPQAAGPAAPAAPAVQPPVAGAFLPPQQGADLHAAQALLALLARLAGQ